LLTASGSYSIMPKILVIDDDATTLFFLQRNLQKEGYDILTANNGEEGLQKAQENLPELIICDWMMPKMDGLEVCRRVKTHPHLTNSTFILLTSKREIEATVQGLDAGADEFISKPVELPELQARLRSGLRQYQLKRLMRMANQQLSQTLDQLRHTQAQLIQSEKMSSLGQMVAGVAHEINNPINFIDGNLDYMAQSIESLFDLIDLYQNHYPDPPEAIKDCIEEMELNFLQTDLQKMMTSLKIGSQRIHKIVMSLQNFSRLNEAQLKQVDIHDGLNSTLVILQQRLNINEEVKIKIERDFEDLPIIECYPGELNQAFFNILTNAIDFIEEKLQQESSLDFVPTIWLYTRKKEPDQIMISIRDNAMGMTAEVCDRIFDPFYTTKPVGKGTGMGMAIVYQTIVEKHHGSLECKSTLGEGTEIIISIPEKQIEFLKG
jgi:two-component system, NtrC family, sensor kinase